MRNFSRTSNTTNDDMANIYESAMMHKSPAQLIAESYETDTEDTLEEGWWDRAKMRGQQAVGAVQGAGQQLKGKAQQVAGNVANAAGQAVSNAANAVGIQNNPSQNKITQAGNNLQQQGQNNIDQGQQQGQQRLVQAATKISQARTQTLLNDIAQDLQKVGINAQIPPQEIKRIQTVIANAIRNSLA